MYFHPMPVRPPVSSDDNGEIHLGRSGTGRVIGHQQPTIDLPAQYINPATGALPPPGSGPTNDHGVEIANPDGSQ